MNGKVSIVLPVFNGERYLKQAVESILRQTHLNFELIIIDDCSTDHSLEIAKAYTFQDSRVQVHANPENIKLPASLNKGFSLAQGDFLTWTSHDNVLKEHFIEVFLESFEKTDYQFLYSKEEYISSEGKILHNNKIYDLNALLFTNPIGASFMYKRIVFEKIGFYNSNLFLIEDYDYWLRISKKFKIGFLDQVLYGYRCHTESLTSKIHDDREINQKFILAVNQLYKSFLGFENQKLVDFLSQMFLGEFKNISKLIYHYNLNESALKALVKNNPTLTWKETKLNFYLILRQVWNVSEGKMKFKDLINIIFLRHEVLFHKKFGLEKSFRLISKTRC